MAPGAAKGGFTALDVLSPRSASRHQRYTEGPYVEGPVAGPSDPVKLDHDEETPAPLNIRPAAADAPISKPARRHRSRWIYVAGASLVLVLFIMCLCAGIVVYTTISKERTAAKAHTIANDVSNDVAEISTVTNGTQVKIKQLESAVQTLQVVGDRHVREFTQLVYTTSNATQTNLTTLSMQADDLRQKLEVLQTQSNATDLALQQKVVTLSTQQQESSATTDSLKKQMDTFQTQWEASVADVQKQMDARSLALCIALQDVLTDSAALRTAYVCQDQANWSLGCAGAELVEARVGRFTSAANGPCVDKGTPSQWQACAGSVDVTSYVRQQLKTAGAGGVVAVTPHDILVAGAQGSPCRGTYLQMQVLYKCPVNQAAKEARCTQILTATAAPPVPPRST